MTAITYAVNRPSQDGTGDPARGTLECRPTLRKYATDGSVRLPARFVAPLVDGVAALVLDDGTEFPGFGTEWAWEIVERCDRGIRRYVTFTGPGPLTAADLIDVDPATLDPVAEPEAAWWAAAEKWIYATPDPDDPDALLIHFPVALTDDTDPLILNMPILEGA